MAPTLLVGDSIMVNKAVYLSRVPARGDIVVLAYPLDERRSFIERIVALPGEEILIRGHQVYVNGEVLHEPYIRTSSVGTSAPGSCGYAFGCVATTVPEDSYFVARFASIVSGDPYEAGAGPRWRRFVLAVLTTTVAFSMAAAQEPFDNREEAVCGWLLEKVAFALWSRAAGRPDPEAWKSVPGAERISHTTGDGRVLRGYRIAATRGLETIQPSTGFMLFAQGNAMLADRLLGDLKRFAESGVDVFVYDYRGYGQSEGKRRLKAIVSDYREIFDALRRRAPGHRKYLYGISFGGLVVANVIGGGAPFDRAVIDSTPSRVSPLGCPEQYDPVRHVSAAGAHVMVISGGRDSVVTPSEQAELRTVAGSRGGRVVMSDEFAHPFMDRDPAIHGKRQELIKAFLFSP